MKTAIVSLLATVLWGCSSNFDSPSRLDRARVLAIQAEPPQPALGTTTTLRPLVYVPDGEDVRYTWSWCPLPTSTTDAFGCPIDQAGAEALFARLGVQGAPPLDLGEGDAIGFTNPFVSTTLAALCASGIPAAVAGNAILFACSSVGLPITVGLVVHTSQGDLSAVTYVYLPIDDALPRNQNPVGSGLVAGDPALGQASIGQAPLPRGDHVPLRVLMDEAAAEALPHPAPGEAPYERITLSWYAEGGDFGYRGQGGERTGYLGNPADPTFTFQAALANTWNTPVSADYQGQAARIIVVIRDSRGGISWLTGLAELEMAP